MSHGGVVRVGGVEPSLALHARRGRQVLLVLGAFAFVAVGVLLLLRGDLVAAVAGALSVVVFGLFGVLGVRLALRPGPAVVVDRRGVTDRSSATAAGLVPWSEITGLGVWEHRGQRMVTVAVADPEAVLRRAHPWGPPAQRGPLRGSGRAGAARVGGRPGPPRGPRPAMRASMRLTGTPVNIATVALPMTSDELVREIAALAPHA